MTETYITRLYTDDQGTAGILSVPNFGWSCYTNELPDRGNRRNCSRINTGRYLARWVYSKKFGNVPLLYGVENRSAILIHSGNYAGDTLKGYRTDSEGCILPGNRIAKLNGQRAVLNSKSTMGTFIKLMAGRDFYITVR
jgi:hypothetical protein